jgi:hypothetical protein
MTMTEPLLHSSHLFTLSLTVDPNFTDVGETPYGRRRIATVTGGTFEGEELKGTVLPSPGGDWLLLRRDGVLQLDVRITLKTHDDHLIYMSYRGMRHGPAWVIEQLNKGEKVDPSQYYFRSTPAFETASEKYRFLNRIVCVATGRREPTGPIYEVFHIL